MRHLCRRFCISTKRTMRACCSDAGDFQRPSREISLGIDHIPLIADTTKPVSNHKKKDTPTGVFLFGAALLLRKSGRLRAGNLTCKGNPTKVSLAYIPFLAIYRSAHGQKNLWTAAKIKGRHWRPFIFGFRSPWPLRPEGG